MNLKLERETFLYELNGRGYNFENTDWYDDWEMFEDDHLNMVWEMWLASRNREGYELVPVDTLKRTIGHIALALCHPDNSKDEEELMHKDMVVIEKVLIGVCDEH